MGIEQRVYVGEGRVFRAVMSITTRTMGAQRGLCFGVRKWKFAQANTTTRPGQTVWARLG